MGVSVVTDSSEGVAHTAGLSQVPVSQYLINTADGSSLSYIVQLIFLFSYSRKRFFKSNLYFLEFINLSKFYISVSVM